MATVRGSRGMLCPGVIVHSVTASTNRHGGNWNDVVVELKVDPMMIDAMDQIMRGLHGLVQQGSVMTGSVSPTNSPWVGQATLDEIEGEMERDPEDIEDPITLVTLKQLIEERFDGLDSALRLAVGE